MIAQRAGVELHYQSVFDRSCGHLHQQMRLEPRLIFFGCATDRSPGEKPTGLGRVQFLGVWTEHAVIGRRCAGGLEVRTTLHQSAEQIAIVPNWLVDDLSEPVDFHRPMRRTDLEERIGPECRNYPSAELRLA